VPLVPGDDRYNCGVVPGPPPAGGGDPFLGGRIGPLLTETNPSRSWFQSDHAFDSFISADQPFLAETRPDRAAADLHLPEHSNSNPLFGGARSSTWRGVGGHHRPLVDRDAEARRHRLPAGQQAVPQRRERFGELWIGPKFTFWRNDCTGTLGVRPDVPIPVGSDKVFQDTGTLSLARTQFRPVVRQVVYGTFNVMGTTVQLQHGQQADRLLLQPVAPGLTLRTCTDLSAG
jgi:hypothetical protein